MSRGKILILGVQPPPIGGVTIHVKRLCEHLRATDLKWHFIDIKKGSKKEILISVFSHGIVHLHSSNPVIRLIFTMFCYLNFKKSIVTFHGNLGRYGRIKNFMDIVTVRYASVPVVLNDDSYGIALKYNKRTRVISAFIPEMQPVELVQGVRDSINALRKRCKHIYCTNAYNVSFDKNDNEIYQISALVVLFNKYPQYGLIISDPSGNYEKYLKNKNIQLHQNILLLPFEHDFNAVIRSSDCMIRFTTTDGDSLSVKEALWHGKSVIATDVVSRPEGVILVSPDIAALERLIDDGRIFENKEAGVSQLPANGADDLIKLYKEIVR